MDEKQDDQFFTQNTDFSPFLGSFAHWLIEQVDRINHEKPLLGIPFRKNKGANVTYSLIASILLRLRNMMEVTENDGKRFVKPLAAPVLVAAVVFSYVNRDMQEWKLQYPQGDGEQFRAAATFALLAQGIFLTPEPFLRAMNEVFLFNVKTAFLLDEEAIDNLLGELGIETVTQFLNAQYTAASTAYLDAQKQEE